MTNYAKELAASLNLQEWQTGKVIELIDEGNTIPFIARYRKEMHGSLDDQVIREISEKLAYLRSLDARKEEVRNLIEAQGALTEELTAALEKAKTLSEIDDIYRPYRPKRKTRASVAREKGLLPLAEKILEQNPKGDYPIDMAEGFVNEEKGVNNPEEALQGALDIIAEIISDDAGIRKRLRVVTGAQGILETKAAKDEDSV